MPFCRIRSAACALAALLAAAPLAGAQPAPKQTPKAWDQAAVAKLAADLAKACIALYDEYYDEQGVGGQSDIASGDASENFRLQYKLRRIEEQAQSLAGALAAGKGRDRTLHQVEDIGELADDLREILQRMFVQIPLQQRVDAARAIWVQILPYYGIVPPADTPKRS
jgi:hypothetical protein